MTPFVLATGRDMERQQRTRQELLDKLVTSADLRRQHFGTADVSFEEISAALDHVFAKQLSQPTYINDTYQVVMSEVENLPDGWPEMIWLSIRRLDREVIRDWRELQVVKNILVGEENEGMEMFPAEGRLVDTANQFHLFVFKDPKTRWPFGFTTRAVDNEALSTTKQRPRKE